MGILSRDPLSWLSSVNIFGRGSRAHIFQLHSAAFIRVKQLSWECFIWRKWVSLRLPVGLKSASRSHPSVICFANTVGALQLTADIPSSPTSDTPAYIQRRLRYIRTLISWAKTSLFSPPCQSKHLHSDEQVLGASFTKWSLKVFYFPSSWTWLTHPCQSRKSFQSQFLPEASTGAFICG